MPKHRRRVSRFSFVVWLIALLASMTLLGSMSAAVVMAEEEPAAASDEPTASDPGETEAPPPTSCPGIGGAGPLPTGEQSIGGLVTDSASNPIADLQVRLQGVPGIGGMSTDLTNAEGRYLFEGLGDAAYLVSYFDHTGTYQSGFYAAGSIALSPGDATPVESTGASASNINVTLPDETLSTISGTVLDSAGDPVPGVRVEARGAYFGSLVSCSDTGPDGTYVLTDVRTGVYNVAATKSGFPQIPSAQVTVPPSASGIDFQFPEVHSLTGSVLDEGDLPVAGMSITACEFTLGSCGFGTSLEDGSFEVPGLVEGSYWVVMQDGTGFYNYLDGYYVSDGVASPDFEDAGSVAVPGAPIQLLAVQAPHITGTITNAAGDPLVDIFVNLCNADGCPYQGFTDASGAYSIGVTVLPATFSLRVEDFEGTYPSNGWIRDDGSIQLGQSSAREVVVTDSDVTGVDGVLPGGGRIQADVSVGGAPGAFTSGSIYLDEFEGISGFSTDETGSGTSPALFPGTYFVQAAGTDAWYWYVEGEIGSLSFDAATAVVVSAGSISEIDIALPGAGTFTPEGEDVDAPLDDGTGNTPVTLTFANVTTGGTSSMTVSDSGNPIPDGFQLGLPAVYYDITTTAAFDGNIRVCVSYAGVSFFDPDNIRLFHYDSAIPGWEDITDPPVDTDNFIVCGITDSLSPFVLAERVMTFTGFFQPVDNGALNKVKAGAGVPVKFSLGADFGLDVFENPPSLGVISCANSTVDSVEQTVAVGTSHLVYDASTNQYAYLFKTSKAWAGTCRRLELTFTDGSSQSADFHFTK